MNLKDHNDYCNCEQVLAYFRLLERAQVFLNRSYATDTAARKAFTELKGDIQAALDGMAAFDKANEIDTDPTPWCTHCGPKSACDCGPIAEND